MRRSACQPRTLPLTAACQGRISPQITPTRLTGDTRPEILSYDLMERRKEKENNNKQNKTGACGSMFFSYPWRQRSQSGRRRGLPAPGLRVFCRPGRGAGLVCLPPSLFWGWPLHTWAHRGLFSRSPSSHAILNSELECRNRACLKEPCDCCRGDPFGVTRDCRLKAWSSVLCVPFALGRESSWHGVGALGQKNKGGMWGLRTCEHPLNQISHAASFSSYV